ncbi:MAG: OmpA family protein [Sandaracinaceae bacterium]|nr:OmpA family protein [Sandaracinaceae bacterium]
MRTWIGSLTLALFTGACGASSTPMRLERVVLYQNGVGYFERTGRADAEGVRLRLRAHEVDDVLTTLTVLDAGGAEGDALAPSAVLPAGSVAEDEALALTVGLGGRARPVTLAYSAPTSAWRASYRLVLPEARGADDAWLQVWAVVDNTSAEDWRDVELVLATDAPLSFAVDLRTPRTVARPNLTGHHPPPIAFGPVRAERSTRGDRDGDGLRDEDDRCPDDPEDSDGFEDDDGCPDPDNDGDGIADVDDVCPTEPEAYNGNDDLDGCPDQGRVVLTDSRIEVLDHVYFAAGSSSLASGSLPVVDAVARTLTANPQIRRLEVEGHADASEDSPWRVSAERAAVVRNALVERGVASERLVDLAYGATRPLRAGADERNRRAGFRIEALADAVIDGTSDGAPARGVRRDALARSGVETPLPRTGGGGTRFPVARGVSVPAGSSAMVTILHRPVSGEDVLLHRVDPNVPSSARHPFRAARFVNRSGVDLVAGPISLFARGELVGEGLLDGLRAGENAFVPYAVDDSTHVARSARSSDVPARLLGLTDARLRLERTSILRTTYRVEAGRHAPARLFIRHARSHGYEAVDLPPHTEASPEALLVPLPLAPGRDATLVIEERRPVEGSVELGADLSVDLEPFFAGTDLEPSLAPRVRALLDARAELARVGEESALLSRQLSETARRTAELRQSVTALDERAGASSRAVRQRIAARLAEAVAHAEQLSERLLALRAAEVEARARLRETARDAAF